MINETNSQYREFRKKNVFFCKTYHKNIPRIVPYSFCYEFYVLCMLRRMSRLSATKKIINEKLETKLFQLQRIPCVQSNAPVGKEICMRLTF